MKSLIEVVVLTVLASSIGCSTDQGALPRHDAAVDATSDGAAEAAIREGDTCEFNNTFSCEPSGEGWHCCGGRIRGFIDGPCWPPHGSDAGTPDCTADPNDLGCPCATEGDTLCGQERWSEMRICEAGVWRKLSRHVCCGSSP